MTTYLVRRAIQAALVAGVSAAASWAVRRHLQRRHLRRQRAIDKEMLQTWENEGGSPAPVAARLVGAAAADA